MAFCVFMRQATQFKQHFVHPVSTQQMVLRLAEPMGRQENTLRCEALYQFVACSLQLRLIQVVANFTENDQVERSAR